MKRSSLHLGAAGRRGGAMPAGRHAVPQAVRIGTPLVVATLSFAAYVPALDADFVNYDDQDLFLNNPHYRGFGTAHLHWMFTTTLMGHYQPLTWLSSGLDYQLSGMNPSSYHRNNLILHALNSVLVYFIARRILSLAQGTAPVAPSSMLCVAAGLAAAMFGVHPLRAESVAWATERRDVLSLFFLCAALLAYLKSVAAGRAALASPGWYAVSIILLLVSLLAKAWGMTFVAVAALLDVYPLRRVPARRRDWFGADARRVWLQKIPYLVLGVAAGCAAIYAQRSTGALGEFAVWGISQRLVQGAYGLAFYVRKTLMPGALAIFYDIPIPFHPSEPRFVASVVGVLAALIAILMLRRKWPGLLLACLVYVVTVSPVLGVAQSGPQLVASRYSYVSCVPWAILAGGVWLAIRRRSTSAAGRAACVLVPGVVLAVLLMTAWRQTLAWKNTDSLWAQQAHYGAPSATASYVYACALQSKGDLPAAIAHFRTSLALNSDKADAWYNLANALKATGQFADAEAAYLRAIQRLQRKYTARVNLGSMYLDRLGRLDDALRQFAAAAQEADQAGRGDDRARPYLALGVALARKGDAAGAAAALRVATEYPVTRELARRELDALNAATRR